MNVALITAAAALVGGLVTAVVTGWLASRERVAEELRERRLGVYPPVWKRTSTVSRWPRTNATYADVERLHFDLRSWYYDVGGLFLSENARGRYGELQQIAAAHLSQGRAAADELTPTAYEDLMEVASAFRTALTEDLESRRQRSLWRSIRRERLHKRQRADARRRMRTAGAEGANHRVRYELRAEDQLLQEPSSPISR